MSNLGRNRLIQLLEQLIKDDDPVGVKFLLQGENDRRRLLHQKNNEGLLPVHQACLTGNTNIVHALIDCGADIEAKSSLGWTGLHTATLSGSSDLVHYLLYTCAANVLAKDDMGCLSRDLTLDANISKILKVKLERVRIKSITDSLASKLPTTVINRRHSFAVPIKTHNIKMLPRAKSVQDFRLPEEKVMEIKSELPLRKRIPSVIHSRKYARKELISQGDSNRDSGIFDDVEETDNDGLRTINCDISHQCPDISVTT